MFKRITSTNVYILKLAQDKYYIGKSMNIEKRLQQHEAGKGAAWTKKYKPVALEKTLMNASPFEEDRVVKEYMSKYGIENVRGGTYVRKELDYDQKYMLQQEIRGAHDLCKSCGREGHLEKDCEYLFAKNKETDDEDSGYDSESVTNIFTCKECGEEFESEVDVDKYDCECKSPIRKVKATETVKGRVLTYKMTGYPLE